MFRSLRKASFTPVFLRDVFQWPAKRRFSFRVAVFLLGLAAASEGLTDIGLSDAEEPDAPQWAEEEVALPAFPQENSLHEFYVSELTTHKFYIDTSSLSVGKDGVVRYVLVVRTAGGATNITFEGIRCSTREWKIYASGRRDATWGKARSSQWRPIENKLVNRHHTELWRNLFCPNGTPIRSAAEGHEALRLGKHPETN